VFSQRDIDGMTPVHLASFYGQALVAVQLIEKGGDLLAMSSEETGGLTAAELALEGGHKGTAKVLLDLLHTMQQALSARRRPHRRASSLKSLRGSSHWPHSPSGGGSRVSDLEVTGSPTMSWHWINTDSKK
jgi:ankyrin repeat protein